MKPGNNLKINLLIRCICILLSAALMITQSVVPAAAEVAPGSGSQTSTFVPTKPATTEAAPDPSNSPAPPPQSAVPAPPLQPATTPEPTASTEEDPPSRPEEYEEYYEPQDAFPEPEEMPLPPSLRELPQKPLFEPQIIPQLPADSRELERRLITTWIPALEKLLEEVRQRQTGPDPAALDELMRINGHISDALEKKGQMSLPLSRLMSEVQRLNNEIYNPDEDFRKAVKKFKGEPIGTA